MPAAWLPWFSAGLVAVLVVRWSWLTRKTGSGKFLDLTGAALIALAWHPNVWARLSQGYPGDSIFTLSLPGAVGLIVLTSLLVLLLIGVSRLKSTWLQQIYRTRSVNGMAMLSLDLLLTTLLFVLGITMVPQLHYSYYHLLFELPHQWVIKPLSIADVWHILRVPTGASLATHATGLCGWWLLMLVVLGWLRALNVTSPIWRVVGIFVLANIAWHSIA